MRGPGSGSPNGTVGALEASYLTDLLDGANAAVFALDLDLNVTEWNFRIEDLSGQAREAVLGGPVSVVSAEGALRAGAALVAEGKVPPPFKMRLEPREGEGSGATLLVGMSPQLGKDSAVIGTLCIGQALLDDAGCSGAADAPEVPPNASVQVDSKTKAMVMHELRSPLHGIIGLSTTLAQEKSPMQKALNMISNSAERVLDLVSNIMDYWALAQESPIDGPADPIDLTSLIKETISKAKEVKDKRGKPFLKEKVEVIEKIASVPPIKGNHQGITQMIYHLLHNAFKFTSEGHVTVTVSSDNEAKMVTISVEDSGIGVQPDKIRHIFEPFQQQDSSESRKYEGLGLGLSIVREVTRTHGGSFDVQSKQGCGSTFLVRLPFAPPQSANSAKGGTSGETKPVSKAAVMAPSSPRPRTPRSNPFTWFGPPQLLDWKAPSDSAAQGVSGPEADGPLLAQDLVLPAADGTPRLLKEAGEIMIMSVDDDHINQEVICSALEPTGFQVTCCMSGARCLQELLHGPLPDLLLLKLTMPGTLWTSGLEVLQEQRSLHGPEQLPIIIMATKKDNTSIAKGYEFGANDFIHKPYGPHELAAKVRYHLQLKGTVAASQKACTSPAPEDTKLPKVVQVDAGVQAAAPDKPGFLPPPRLPGHEAVGLRQQLVTAELEAQRMRQELALARADAQQSRQRAEELQAAWSQQVFQQQQGAPSGAASLKSADIRPQSLQTESERLLLFLQWQNAHIQAELRHKQVDLASTQAQLKRQAAQSVQSETLIADLNARLEHLELDSRMRALEGIGAFRYMNPGSHCDDMEMPVSISHQASAVSAHSLHQMMSGGTTVTFGNEPPPARQRHPDFMQ